MKTAFVILAILCSSPYCFAQTKKITKTILLPDFFHYGNTISGDTTYHYDCIDADHRKIYIDLLVSINDVHEIEYLKSFYRYPPTPGAIVSPPYVSKKLFVYERSGTDTWSVTDGLTNEETGLKENKKVIVRADTVNVVNPITNNQERIIHKYYKTEKISAEGMTHGHDHHHNH